MRRGHWLELHRERSIRKAVGQWASLEAGAERDQEMLSPAFRPTRRLVKGAETLRLWCNGLARSIVNCKGWRFEPTLGRWEKYRNCCSPSPGERRSGRYAGSVCSGVEIVGP